MGIFRAYKVLTRWQKVIVIISTLFVIYTFLIFFILPKIIQNISQKKLTELLGRQTTISKIIINPYSFLVILEDFEIRSKDADHSFLAIGQVKVNLQASSIFKLGPVIKEIAISDPKLHLTINEDGSYNFSDLLPDKTAEDGVPQTDRKDTSSTPLRFFLANIRLHNGEILIEDLAKNTKHTLTEMNLAVPFVSNMDSHVNIFVTPYFAVNFNGAPFELKGKSKPFIKTLTTTMEFSLRDLELPKYFAYNPVPTNVDLVAGKLSCDFSLDFSSPEIPGSPPQILLSGNLTLDDVDIRGPGSAELFNLMELHVALSRSEILKGMINLDKLSISSPVLSLNRDDQNGMNVYNLLPRDQEEKAPQPAVEKQELPLQLTIGQINIDDLQVNYSEEESSRNIFSIDSFSLENAGISGAAHEVTIGKTMIDGGKLNIFRLDDGILNLAALAPPEDPMSVEQQPRMTENDSPKWEARLEDFVLQNFEVQAGDLVEQGLGNISLEDIELHSRQFSNATNQQGDAQLNLKINQSGSVDIAGKIGIDPLQADVEFSTSDIQIEWFQAFISQAANIVIPEGAVAGQGHITLKKEPEAPIHAQLTGDISIADFKSLGSNDNRDLFSFKNLALQGMKIDAEPFFVDLQSISLKSPSANLVVAEDGVLNFSRIARTDSSHEKEVEKPEKNQKDKAAPFRIGLVSVENGKVAVHDRSISPNFNTTLTKINSKVTSLSSDAKNQPAFNLNAMVNKHTPLKIDGKINPLTTNLYLDIRMILKDMDLGVFTPYSGKYAGYTIQKGKMTLDLDYAIKDNTLNAKNDVFLDQFDFGKEVKSEDAVNAPVTLAVALLKDPSGRISLDLPITGNLDDPEFSIGGVVVEMIMNLLVKAATAPFSLLGAMFGGGEDLNVLNFKAGTATLTEQESEKVKTLITALTQRPALKLDIGGYVNIELDKEALKQLRLERQFKSEEMKKRISQGSTVTTVEDIQLSDEEYLGYLQAAFAAIPPNPAKSDKGSAQPDAENPGQTTPSGKDKNGSAPPTQEEMLQAVMEQMNITDDDLSDLAQQRAMVVKDAFILDGGIDAARIQTTAPDTLEPQEESLRSAGVIMTLQ